MPWSEAPHAGAGRSRRMGALSSKLLLLFLSTAITLLLLEGLARIAAARPSGGGLSDYVEHDPVLGWRKRPGVRVSFPRGDYAMNARGLRDRERDYAVPAGVFRIMALGDSFTEGFSVPFEACFTQALERELSQAQCGVAVEVVNAGTVAYSTDQEYLFYLTEGWRYSPGVVLLLFYYNDILYNARAYYTGTPKPLLEPVDGSVRRPSRPVPAGTPFLARGDSSRAQGSAALHWLRQRLVRSSPRAYNALALFGLWPPVEPAEPGLELRVYSRRPPSEVTKAWEATSAILASLAREVSDRGSRLLVIYVPSKMEVSDRDWRLTRLRYRIDEGGWNRGLVGDRLRQIGQTYGFPVLDLTEGLRGYDQGLWGGPYHSEGGHWNALGHRVAASEVSRFLRGHDWIPSCPRP